MRLRKVAGSAVHSSAVGGLFDPSWPGGKSHSNGSGFRDRMDEILLCDTQDRAFMGGRRNQMIGPSHALRTMFSGLKGWLGDSGGLEFTDPIPDQAIRRAALSGVADPQFFFAVA